MDPKRWQKIEALYHSALRVNASERSAWLLEACERDESIRLEVLSLIESAEITDSFMEEPVLSLGMSVLTREPDKLIGTKIGRYEVLEILGHGGMGEVYLAQDLRLGRRVALKLLPASITEDRERVLRFEREARAASAISHPNVAHIYEIGESNGCHYIAMEYVNGRTLRQLVREQPLDLKTTLDIAIQLGTALAAAHRAAIIHRDIKPENVIMSDAGYVKVLDFGLAKLIDTAPATETNLLSSLHTEPEILMGTAHYMSPEQVRREPVDLRTDLWSLGVVLYEMLTGRRPFQGQSFSEVIIAIIEKEPEFAGNEFKISSSSQAILQKALQKQAANRYQTAAEFVKDLQQLRHDPDSNESGSNPTPSTSTNDLVRSKTVPQRLDTVVDESAPQRPRSKLMKNLARGRSIPLALVILLVFAVGGYLRFFRKNPRTLSERSVNLRFERLNLSGSISDITLSPDGKYVASIVAEAGKHTIHVTELATQSDLRIIPASDKRYSGLSFSPDNTYVYFLENNTETGTLYRVSKFGGGPHKILDNVNTAVTFSPDGSRIAFIRITNEKDPGDLMIANADGTGENMLAQRNAGDAYRFSQDSNGPGPVWSPDGKRLACASLKKPPENASMIEIIDVNSGASHSLGEVQWSAISRFVWLADGSGLIVAGRESATKPWQLSRVSYPEGKIQQITSDPNNYTRLSAAANSRAFLTLNTEDDSNIWAVPVGEGEQFSPRIVSEKKGVTEVAVMRDGRLLYVLFDGVNSNLWRQDADGANAEQLTFGANVDFGPVVSATVDPIVFVSDRSGHLNLWRMDSHGANLKQLTSGPYEDQPSVTPDGNWVVYRTKGEVWKIRIDGQNASKLYDKGSLYPIVSPDGSKLAFFTKAKLDSKRWHLEVRNFQTLALLQTFELAEPANPFFGLRWTPQGDGLTYISSADGSSNLWVQPLTASAPKRLTEFRDAEIQSFSWSADGRQIICLRRLKTYIPIIVLLF
jgi:eukaryotic-like serine/threonine-protein kinase